MDYLNEESKERQKQKIIIKDYSEVKDLNEHVNDRPRDEELNK